MTADHAEQAALAHAAAGEKAQALAAAAGGERVHHAHAGLQRLADAGALGGIRNLAHDALARGARGDGPEIVERPAERVEDAAEHLGADGHLVRPAGGAHRGSDGDAFELLPRHEADAAVAEADHLGQRFLAAARGDGAGLAERRGRALRFDGEADDLGDAADRPGAVEALEPFLVAMKNLAGHALPSRAV